MSIPARLECLVRWVPPGTAVADVGSGHGLLPIYLVQKGIARRAVATENRPGPWVAVRRAVEEAGLTHLIEVRLGDGLQALRPGEEEVIILAGLGGGTMARILSVSRAVAEAAHRLILQPVDAPERVRSWLLAAGWDLVSEELVCQRGRVYDALLTVPRRERVLEGGAPALAEEVEALVREGFSRAVVLAAGPLLLRQRHPLLHRKAAERLSAGAKLLRRLEAAAPFSFRARQKAEQIRSCLAEWEKVERWLKSYA